MWIINQSKDRLVIWHALLLVFDHYNKIPLAINITVQRLDINVALGILRCDLPFFEFNYNFIVYCMWAY